MKTESNNISTLSSDEYISLSSSLEKHHAVFYKMWTLGRPLFINDTQTAFVAFDKVGDTCGFCMNKNFWDSLDFVTKQFVIAHECLHVILNHGRRIMGTENKEIANIAADIVVNHLLINKFGFKRNDIKNEKDLCWIDTVFLKHKISDNESFEYYYNLLNKKSGSKETSKEQGDGSGKGQGGGDKGKSLVGDGIQGKSLVDDHSKMMNEVDADDMNQKLNKELSGQEKESIQDTIEKHYCSSDFSEKQRGNVGGHIWVFANTEPVTKKKKWETVIKKWASKYTNIKDRDAEQWARLNRRFVFMNGGLFLPSEMETEDKENDKIDVWFFQDTSGSCYHLANRFFKAAQSLPTDRFNIRTFCFDTEVYETNIKTGKLYGFGGTSFSCIEQHIKSLMKKDKLDYPVAIFVITDGYGDYVHPQKPANWYWFLNTTYYNCIPKESHKYNLSNFE